MNCQTFTSATSWDCIPAGQNCLQVFAPVSLGLDGQLASFYVMEDAPGRFFLTDAHGAVSHAIDHGARVTPTRLERAGATPGNRFASLTADGEITAEGDSSDLKFALWDALRLALVISANELAWQPRTRQERFATQVWRTLKEKLPPGSVVAKPRMEGVSGHQIEFPFGIILPNSMGIRAVQPIGISDDHRIDWGYVYQSYGKLSDLKKATPADVANRVVVMEGGASDAEFGKAATVLSESAKVLLYQDDEQFAELMAA